MIGVIINGDDFGLAPAVNEGIVLAHTRGCLTSTSICVSGPAATEAAEAARGLPDLGVGLHLTLVAEQPVSPPQTIRSLVDIQGVLPRNAFAFAWRWLTGRIRPDDARREVRAQLERAGELGLQLTHLDSHQHLHVLPGLFEIVAEEMRRVGVAGVRIPLETCAVGDGGWARRVYRVGLNRLARRAAKVARGAGLAAPAHFVGFLGAGHMDLSAFLSRIEILEEGVTDFALHPAAGAALPRRDFASWGYEWHSELAALVDASVGEALDRRGIVRMHYGQLPTDDLKCSGAAR